MVFLCVQNILQRNLLRFMVLCVRKHGRYVQFLTKCKENLVKKSVWNILILQNVKK